MVTSPTKYLFIRVEKGGRHSIDMLQSIKFCLATREGTSAPGCFHDIKLPCWILIPQRTCQIRFGAILGVTEQTFHTRFVGVGIVLLFHGIAQFDGHFFLDHGVKEIVDGNHFLVCDIRSIGFGYLALEFHVALGQVDVVWGRFNVEFNGTATLDSRLGSILSLVQILLPLFWLW